MAKFCCKYLSNLIALFKFEYRTLLIGIAFYVHAYRELTSQGHNHNKSKYICHLLKLYMRFQI